MELVDGQRFWCRCKQIFTNKFGKRPSHRFHSWVRRSSFPRMTLSLQRRVFRDFDNVNNTNLINRVARQVLNAGEACVMPSPCGVNCSYVMEFEGPLISCNHSTLTNNNQRALRTQLPIYSGQWVSNPSAH